MLDRRKAKLLGKLKEKELDRQLDLLLEVKLG